MTDHRRPPTPIWYDSALPGQCRFCGGMIIVDGQFKPRRHWHLECAFQWMVMNSPADARRAVFRRDGGVCAGCGGFFGRHDWDVDHVVPLVEATEARHWQLGNMQTLCHECHVTKTNRDRVRRSEGEQQHER